MLGNAMSTNEVVVSVASTATDVVKQVYVKPILIALGDVRDVTLGGSPGSGDSGNPGAQRF
jgi:hypothetical protein